MAQSGAQPLPNSETQPLPQNQEAEISILGAILSAAGEQAMSVAAEQLKPGDFFAHANRFIFAAMLEMRAAGTAIDLVTLCDYLERHGGLERVRVGEISGAGYVAQLNYDPGRALDARHIGHYCEIVREKAQRRRVISIGQSVLAQAGNALHSNDDLLNTLRLGLQEAEPHGSNGNGLPHARSVADFVTMDLPKHAHLVEFLLPCHTGVLIFSKPRHLKSWLTMALAMQATRAGMLFGKIEVKKPVRTLLVSIEDPAEYVQDRMRLLLGCRGYRDIDLSNLRLITRDMVPGIGLPDAKWKQYLMREIDAFKADHVELDVLRKFIMPGLDINKPGDAAEITREFEEIQDKTGATVTVSHHHKKGEADIFDGAAGSFNFAGWAKVLCRLKEKREEKRPERSSIISVSIETQNGWGLSLEGMRLVLDLEADEPLRLEDENESTTVQSIEWKLGKEWTVRDLMEAAGIERATAYKRTKTWMDNGIIERVGGSKPTRGGMGRFCFVKSPAE